MAHFAKLGLDNTVKEVVVIANEVLLDDNGVEQESLGQGFIAALGFEGTWLQCSYNGNFRGSYPGYGWAYDVDSDEFIPPVVGLSEG